MIMIFAAQYIMQPTIFKTIESSEFYIPERCHIIEIMNQPGIDFSVARARVEPGVTTALHAVKGTTEAYYILKGKGAVQLENLRRENIAAGDVVFFPPGVPQSITNTGNEDLIFLAICCPRFRPASYEHLEAGI